MSIKQIIFLIMLMISVTNLTAVSTGSKIESYLNSLENFSGVVLVAKNGQVIHQKGYGFAVHEFEIPNTAKTKFQIGSNTKSFTAFAIMQLQERNLLHTHDKLSKYIPDYPQGDKITLHHLLTHTSGIQDYYKKWDDVRSCKNLAHMVDAFKTWPLDFEPGTSYSYSNSSYSLLAYLIEKVSGVTYEAFLTENIFKPLHMNDTGSYNLKVVKNRAYGYVYENNALHNAHTIENPVTLLGCGDLYSTLEDMYKWDRALYSGKILSKENIKILFSPHVAMEGSLTRAHGYGWFIDTKFDRHMVEFSGFIRGFLSKFIRFIDDDVSIILLTNGENHVQFVEIYEGLMSILFDS